LIHFFKRIDKVLESRTFYTFYSKSDGLEYFETSERLGEVGRRSH